MVECSICPGPLWTFCISLSILFATLCFGQIPGHKQLYQETIIVNVSTLQETERVIEQVMFNVSCDQGQIHINGYPVNRGVTRITCKMDIFDYNNINEWEDQAHQGLVSLRVFVQDRPVDLDPERTMIVVQEEVVTVNGNQVQQKDATELQLVVNNEMRIINHSSVFLALEETLLYAIPRGNDVYFTVPNIEETDESSPQHTTGEYNLRQNTTVDEEPFPGKLPETPIRAEIPASSYKVMCQFAEDLREKLCYIWLNSYPVLMYFVHVVVIGIIGAAIVLEILKTVYPSRERKGILLSNEIKDAPVFVPLMSPDMGKMDNSQDKENIL
ncbi:glycoprotein integral membrane protein 1 isoform X2 [Bombina bombina]|uniref:glycoprotein integral membrane protein 1 isoform X2 n=1 Tax=Bombina bombina TaxID=8345 RepID=UPI00235A9890|nr:glycoprotein integral membrane protein 1 isoform X2 [Bombina bombina]